MNVRRVNADGLICRMSLVRVTASHNPSGSGPLPGESRESEKHNTRKVKLLSSSLLSSLVKIDLNVSTKAFIHSLLSAFGCTSV